MSRLVLSAGGPVLNTAHSTSPAAINRNNNTTAATTDPAKFAFSESPLPRFNAAAIAIVKRRVQAAKGVYLFPHRKDANKPMLKANNAHDNALKKSKVRKFRLYDLRHTWATRATESGEVDMPTLAALLGHSKLNMVMR